MNTKVLLTLLAAVCYLLLQDFWNREDATPLVFRFLPAGLACHVCYSLCAAGILALLVKFAWPVNAAPDSSESPGAGKERP